MEICDQRKAKHHGNNALNYCAAPTHWTVYSPLLFQSQESHRKIGDCEHSACTLQCKGKRGKGRGNERVSMYFGP